MIRLALAHDHVGDPSDAALAAATEASDICQRVAASPQADERAWRRASQAREGLSRASQAQTALLFTRDRLLLPDERAWFHRSADLFVGLQDVRDRLYGESLPLVMPLGDMAAKHIQGSLSRLDAAAAIARSFLTARGCYPALDAANSAVDHARRCLDLYLAARRISRICQRDLSIAFPGRSLAEDGEQPSPAEAAEAAEQAEQASADAENAFADLIHQLSGVIADNDELFARCMRDLFKRVLRRDSEGWWLISATVRNRAPYKWIFADERIAADVAALAFLERVGDGTEESVDDVDIDHWIDRALLSIFEKTGPRGPTARELAIELADGGR